MPSSRLSAFLGGFAKQVTERLEEDRKRVEEFVDEAILQDRKSFLEKEKEFDETVNSLVKRAQKITPFLGADPDARQQAIAIAQQGDDVTEQVLEALKSGSPVDSVINITLNQELPQDVKNSSLKKMAQSAVSRPGMTFTTPTGVREKGTIIDLFSPSVEDVYNERLAEQQAVGMLPATGRDPRQGYTMGTVVFKPSMFKADTLDREYDRLVMRQDEVDPNSPEYQSLNRQIVDVTNALQAKQKAKTVEKTRKRSADDIFTDYKNYMKVYSENNGLVKNQSLLSYKDPKTNETVVVPISIGGLTPDYAKQAQRYNEIYQNGNRLFLSTLTDNQGRINSNEAFEFIEKFGSALNIYTVGRGAKMSDPQKKNYLDNVPRGSLYVDGSGQIQIKK